jgi:hypothetical protein
MTTRVEITHLACSGDAIVWIYRKDGTVRECFFLHNGINDKWSAK